MSTIITHDVGMYQVYVLLPIGVVISIAIWFTSPKKNDIPKYFVLIALFGATVALVWTYLINVILIDLLSFIGIFFPYQLQVC